MSEQVPIDSIIVRREKRQRQSLSRENIDYLKTSFTIKGTDGRPQGQLQPIVLTRVDNLLVIGEHRLEAARELGWTCIKADYTDETDALALSEMELSENLARKDMMPVDKAKAIAEIHAEHQRRDPTWRQEHTAARYPGEPKAQETVSKLLQIHKWRDDPQIKPKRVFAKRTAERTHSTRRRRSNATLFTRE